jgi:hypothetical protein
MSFHAQVGQELLIDGVAYRIAEHPAAVGMPYGQEGRAGIVYQLSGDGERRALKVFRARYQVPALVTLAERLEPFSRLPGLLVCKRSLITARRHIQLVREHPDLTYAVLMPWIEGPTWMEVILEGRSLTPEQSLELARSLVEVLTGMEERGLAHCDLSASNLLLPALATTGHSDAQAQFPVELVDVEQMYGEELRRPEYVPSGSAGYAHAVATEGVWSVYADRFSGAVLLAEILGWCDPRVRATAWGESYFDPNELQQQSERYQLLWSVLNTRFGANSSQLLERAWESDTLSDCATFGHWLAALPDYSLRLETPAPVETIDSEAPPIPSPTGPQAAPSSGVSVQPSEAPGAEEEIDLIALFSTPFIPVTEQEVAWDDEETAALFDDGLAAFQQGEWFQARELLEEVVRRAPDYERHEHNASRILGSIQEELTALRNRALSAPTVVPVETPAGQAVTDLHTELPSETTVPQSPVELPIEPDAVEVIAELPVERTDERAAALPTETPAPAVPIVLYAPQYVEPPSHAGPPELAAPPAGFMGPPRETAPSANEIRKERAERRGAGRVLVPAVLLVLLLAFGGIAFVMLASRSSSGEGNTGNAPPDLASVTLAAATTNARAATGTAQAKKEATAQAKSSSTAQAVLVQTEVVEAKARETTQALVLIQQEETARAIIGQQAAQSTAQSQQTVDANSTAQAVQEATRQTQANEQAQARTAESAGQATAQAAQTRNTQAGQGAGAQATQTHRAQRTQEAQQAQQSTAQARQQATANAKIQATANAAAQATARAGQAQSQQLTAQAQQAISAGQTSTAQAAVAAQAATVQAAQALSQTSTAQAIAAIAAQTAQAVQTGTAHAIAAAAGTATAQAAIPATWNLVSSPNVGRGNEFRAIAAVASNDVWAVGMQNSSGAPQTLTQHWDGALWSVVPSPNIGGLENALYGVAARARDDVWAVGRYIDPGNGTTRKTLAMHWDGRAWSITPTENGGFGNSYLQAIRMFASNDVWAVGFYGMESSSQPLTMHWDGGHWSLVANPTLDNSAGSRVFAVDGTSTTDLWAVGHHFVGGVAVPFTMHWDGSRWSVVSSPTVSGVPTVLRGVKAIAPNNALAVGYSGASGTGQAVIHRWDGSTWRAVPSPAVGEGSFLWDIEATSANDVWAAGNHLSGGVTRTLIERWNGQEWSVVQCPNAGTGGNYIFGLAIISAREIWGAGFSVASPDATNTLVALYK